MKNTTIVRDELGILNAGKSAILVELGKARTELHDIQRQIIESQSHLNEVQQETKEEMARLDDLRDRAFSVKTDMANVSQEYKTIYKSYETVKVKNAQAERQHSLKIKDLVDKKEELEKKIDDLKSLFDLNSKAYTVKLSEIQREIKKIEADRDLTKKALETFLCDLAIAKEEDRKITKERLKREDKLRTREKLAELREKSLNKKEEDIMSASRDIVIVYNRLKELYHEIDPTIDLERLVLQLE